MAQQASAIVDKLLTNVSNAYTPEGFVAEQVLPALPVFQTTGKIGGYTNDYLRIVNTVHSGEGEYARIDSIVRQESTYDIEEHGLQGTITDKTFRNVERPYDARLEKSMSLNLALHLGKEKALADTLTDGSIITQGTTLSGNAQYNNRTHADSKPIEDMQTARDTMLDACGVAPNAVVMPEKVYNALRFHAEILEGLGYTPNRVGQMKHAELMAALELDFIFVAKAQYNSAKQGQTVNLTPVWGKDMVYFRRETPGLMQKCLGYEVRKSGTQPRQVVRQANFTPVGSEEVAVTDNYDQLILDATCAYLIQDAIA